MLRAKLASCSIQVHNVRRVKSALRVLGADSIWAPMLRRGNAGQEASNHGSRTVPSPSTKWHTGEPGYYQAVCKGSPRGTGTLVRIRQVASQDESAVACTE